MTACDEPYIGEESIRRPPSRKKAPMTAAHSSRSSGSSPTLNVTQLPRPITGTFSPLDGIGLVTGVARASAESGRSMTAAALAATTWIAARRLRGTGSMTRFEKQRLADSGRKPGDHETGGTPSPLPNG